MLKTPSKCWSLTQPLRVSVTNLGDDFRYDSAKEWDLQYQNYEKIMEFINYSPELNAEVKFGTLADYFASVNADSSVLLKCAQKK